MQHEKHTQLWTVCEVDHGTGETLPWAAIFENKEAALAACIEQERQYWADGTEEPIDDCPISADDFEQTQNEDRFLCFVFEDSAFHITKVA